MSFQGSHVTQVSDIFVLLTVATEALVTFVFCGRRGLPSTLLATPLTFAHRLLSRGTLLVVRETRLVSKMSVAVVAGGSDLRERARRTGRTIATRLVRDVRDITPTRLITTFTHILLGHGSRKDDNHVIIAIDIVV